MPQIQIFGNMYQPATPKNCLKEIVRMRSVFPEKILGDLVFYNAYNAWWTVDYLLIRDDNALLQTTFYRHRDQPISILRDLGMHEEQEFETRSNELTVWLNSRVFRF